MACAQLDPLVRHLRGLVASQAAREQCDRDLLQAFSLRNDEAAFAALVWRHGPMVLGVCRQVLGHEQDAEDAFQATFLVLARKASLIRKGEALASWLHRVAHYTAMKAKTGATKRRVHEARAKTTTPRDPSSEAACRELQIALNEEIQRLPARYRDPFVLCFLEGQSRAEAARELSLAEGTVWSRLARARRRLQEQLARRGLVLSAALGAAGLGQAGAGAAVPGLLAKSTTKAALSFAASKAVAAELVSAEVAALAKGVLQTMFVTKAKITTALLLALGVAAGAGQLTHQVLAGKNADAAQPAASKAPAEDKAKADSARSSEKSQRSAPQREGNETVEVHGRVLNVDGKPAAGAKVSVCFPDQLLWLATAADGAAKKPLHAIADGDGRFAIPVPRGDRDMGVKIVAAAEGVGPDWVEVSAHNADKAVTLRLRADDVAIEGRVLDLERRPVAGAAVEVRRLERPADGGDLTAWISAARSRDRLSNPRPPMKSLTVTEVAGIATSAATDKAGRFRLTGFGRETVALLGVRGEGVENKTIEVCTRDDKAALVFKAAFPIYPARFELLLGPGKVATGTVTEKGTGKPVAGAAVEVDGIAWGRTDAKGRYRLTGVGKRDTHYAFARGPHHFINLRQNVPDSPGAEPLTVDFELQPAREIRGRLIDKDGRPVRGFVWYSARPDNANLKDLNAQPPALGVGAGRPTTADGAFRVLACPGPGYLVAKAEQDRFMCAEFKEYKGNDPFTFNIPGWRGDLVPAVPANLVPSHCHAIVAVEPSPDDAKSWTHDIVLDPGKTVKGKLVGPDGKPMVGALAFGLTAIMTTQPWMNDQPERITRLKGADFTAFGVNPREPRPVVFVYPEKNLGKLMLLRGDEKEPLEVRLEPLGTATGRLVDSKGKPAAGTVISPSIDTMRIARKDRKNLPGDFLYFAGSSFLLREPRPYPAPVTVDATGHFKFSGLLPGIKYMVNSFPEAPGGGYYFLTLGTVSLEAGKTTKDLGDLKLPDVP